MSTGVDTSPFPKRVFCTDPNTGRGRACTVLAQDDGSYLIRLDQGMELVVTAGDLYVEDESGRYLGGPGDLDLTGLTPAVTCRKENPA